MKNYVEYHVTDDILEKIMNTLNPHISVDDVEKLRWRELYCLIIWAYGWRVEKVKLCGVYWGPNK